MKKKNFLFVLFFCFFSSSIGKSFDYCASDKDCEVLNTCDPIKKECVHKDFLPPTLREIIGGFFIVIGSALSNAGGIGGGGLLIPILLILLNFKTHEAIPISKLMIFTGAVTSFLMGLKNKNPYRNVIAVDLNIALILIPLILFGTMVGVTLNRVTPPWIILVCLAVCLVVNTWKTIKKGLDLWNKETKEMKEKELKVRMMSIENDELDKSTDEENNLSKEDINYDERIKDISERKREIKKKDDITLETDLNPLFKRQIMAELTKDNTIFNIDKLIFLFIAYLLLLIITLAKGSEHVSSIIGLQSCSYTYWFVYICYCPLSLGITYMTIKVVSDEYIYRKEICFPYHPNDIKWNSEIFFNYPLYAFFGGVMAGLLGVGGGLILGPLLLELGIHPLISTATSNFLVLFTSSSTSIQFIFMGMMNLRYGFFCTICSTFGSYIGTYFIQKLMEKTGRNSILIFSLAAVLGMSTLFIPAHTLFQTIQKYNQGINIWEMKSPC